MSVKHLVVTSMVSLALAAAGCTSSQNKRVEVGAQPLKPRPGVPQAATPAVPLPQAQQQPQQPQQPQNGVINTNPPASGDAVPGATASTGSAVPSGGSGNTVPPLDGATPPLGAQATNPPATPPSANEPATPPAGATPPSGTSAQDLGGGKTRLGGITVTGPAGFAVAQQGQAEGTTFVGYAKGEDFVAVYAKAGSGMTTRELFVNGAQVTAPEASKRLGKYDWKIISTTKTVGGGVPHAGTVNVTGFLMEQGGTTYYGYAKSVSAETAQAVAEAVLSGIE